MRAKIDAESETGNRREVAPSFNRRYRSFMAGKLSGKAQSQLNTLRLMADKVQHVYGLVERFAATRDAKQAEQAAPPLKRALGRLKLDLMGAGLDALSQLAGSMEIAAGRGGAPAQKTRILREGIGSIRFQLEQEQRAIIAEDQREQAGEQGADGDRPEAGPGPAGTRSADSGSS
ncbi:MAG TPA: hypothetical protein VMM83_08645 [Longimicrobiales bacterium]|nr:hypothetical protein [Longimicrobiales bacterium]